MPYPDFQLSDCWAKTDSLTGMPALTVRDHCLIVGAVAEAASDLLAPACRRILPEGAVTLTAAHDIGKITPGFLRKSPLSLFSKINGSQNCVSDHALVSQTFLASLSAMQDERGHPLAWGLCAGGHHGSYPTTEVRNNLGRRDCLEIGEWPNLLRLELLNELIKIFGPLPNEHISKGARIHWLTGFVTFCDWIGSNTDWFGLNPEEPLRDHYSVESVRALATEALDRIGWHRRAVHFGLSFKQLFSASGIAVFKPRPLQEVLIELADQPGLYIVEAPMGMGKTEAALAAAYRRWTEGEERGLYFALPTQLTSNLIHVRVTEFLDRVVANDSTQTLVHGNAWLSEERVRSFSPAPTSGSDAGALEARRWFTTSRKPLLAPFGTGTIDQALMACIAAKHSALRLFALSGKVIVIDEVHSYDVYTTALVNHLICWLLEVGSTVIVLSATLTAHRRSQMVKAAGSVEPTPAPLSYPMITKVIGTTTTHHPVFDPSIKETTVRLKHLDLADTAVIKKIVHAAQAGACVLVIRNTVALAQETFRAVKSALSNEEILVGLLHSRFPHFQREKNEDRWMDLLGKTPTCRPAGCILVATQVVEQSVDIDADLLVTDLAPTDLLLQRMGRLHRHARQRPAGFEKATCWILQPTVDWDASPKKIRAAIGSSSYIYPPSVLYKSQVVWSKRDSVILPIEIRELLESSESLPNIPKGAFELEMELVSKTENMIQKALRQGPFQNESLDDTECAQTRYNMQPSALLILLRVRPQTRGHETIITPLMGDSHTVASGLFNYDLAKSLHENAVRIPRYLVCAAMKSQPSWVNLHVSEAVVAICSPDSTLLEIIGGEELSYQLSYQNEQGIRHEKTREQKSLSDDAEELDSWF